MPAAWIAGPAEPPGPGSAYVPVTQVTTKCWNSRDEIALPRNAGASAGAALDGVSCPGTGSCVAVGYYEDNSGQYQAMAAVSR